MLKIYHNTRICINLRWSPREQWTRGIFLKITLQPAQRGFIFPLHHVVICDQMKVDGLFYSVSQIRFFMIFFLITVYLYTYTGFGYIICQAIKKLMCIWWKGIYTAFKSWTGDSVVSWGDWSEHFWKYIWIGSKCRCQVAKEVHNRRYCH